MWQCKTKLLCLLNFIINFYCIDQWFHFPARCSAWLALRVCTLVLLINTSMHMHQLCIHIHENVYMLVQKSHNLLYMYIYTVHTVCECIIMHKLSIRILYTLVGYSVMIARIVSRLWENMVARLCQEKSSFQSTTRDNNYFLYSVLS